MSDLPADETTTFTVPDHVLTRRTSGETVLLSLESEEYFGLDNVGNRVWQLIEEEATFASTVAAIAEEFDVDPDTAAADLSSLLRDLLDANLVVRATGR